MNESSSSLVPRSISNVTSPEVSLHVKSIWLEENASADMVEGIFGLFCSIVIVTLRGSDSSLPLSPAARSATLNVTVYSFGIVSLVYHSNTPVFSSNVAPISVFDAV